MRKKNKLVIDDDSLIKLYVNEKRSSYEIGRMYGVAGSTVRRRLCNIGIKLRDNRKVTDDDEMAIAKAYTDGATIKELAGMFGLGETQINRILVKHKIEKRSRPPFIDVPRADFVKMYVEDHLPVTEIARKLHCSTSAINNIRIRYRIPPRYCKKKHVKITKEELRHLYEDEQLTAEEIADIYGCSKTTISMRMCEYGIKPRDQERIIDGDELAALYADGNSIMKICDLMGANERVIKRAMDKNNIAVKPPGIFFNRDTLYDLYIVKGMKQSEIAQLYDCSTGVVNVNLMKYGISKRPFRYDLDTGEVVALRKQGLSVAEIADKFGCSASVIYSRLK